MNGGGGHEEKLSPQKRADRRYCADARNWGAFFRVSDLATEESAPKICFREEELVVCRQIDLDCFKISLVYYIVLYLYHAAEWLTIP